jgi:glycosyltransferase involved in cell wall biosynthesis
MTFPRTATSDAMTTSPLVTIGLPVYNSERYLQQSLDSLLGQTYADFVLIISDNASTDGTAEICRRAAASDSRVRYHRNEVNIGNPGNFNHIFQLCTTKYLKWATSDDLWEPTFLERAIEVMERDDSIALCYPKSFVVEADNPEPKPYEDNLHLMQDDPADRFNTLIDSIGLAHQHLGVIRTSCLRQTHLLAAYPGSDINLLAELTLYGKYYELPERLFYRRFHPKSGSWQRTSEKHQREHYMAANSKRMPFLQWRQHLGFMSTVRSSPIPLRSKLRIYRRVLRNMRWNRDCLLREITEYARTIAH